MIKINHKYALITCVYTLISLILYFCLNIVSKMEYQTAIEVIGYFVIFQVLLTFVAYRLTKIEMFSLSGAFTWLNYLFHLGQPVIKALTSNYQFDYDVSLIIVSDAFMESLIFSYLMIVMVSAGILLTKSVEREKVIHKKRKFSEISAKNLFKIGSIITVLTFPIEMYIQITKIFVARNSGYLATFDVEVSGVIGFISTFSLVGVIIMILGSKNHFKRGTIILGLYSVFYVITMFSGGRMWQVIKLLLVLYYYIKTYDIKITKKNIVILLLLAYFGAGFMSAVADFRSYDVQSNDYVFQVITDVFVENPILKIVEEFGGTIYTVGLTVQKTPFVIPFSMGSQFITNFVSILPNVNDSIATINNNSNFTLLLDTPNIGGSFVGEMYYSFHYFAFIPAILIGILVQIITKKIENSLEDENYRFIIYSLMFQYSFISWIRGASSILYRNHIFAVIFIYILSSIFIRKKNADEVKTNRQYPIINRNLRRKKNG